MNSIIDNRIDRERFVENNKIKQFLSNYDIYHPKLKEDSDSYYFLTYYTSNVISNKYYVVVSLSKEQYNYLSE